LSPRPAFDKSAGAGGAAVWGEQFRCFGCDHVIDRVIVEPK
jgi:hypothetical protein